MSSTPVITKKSVAIPQRAALRHAAMIGNFPPRLCGIATFTRDMLDGLGSASPGTKWDVVALDDGRGPYQFPERVTRTIAQQDADAYLQTADALNREGVEAVFIQHEFGIYGGAAGQHLLLLMRRLRMPIFVTLHTVLENPDADQRRVMDEILKLASGVGVMAEKGADILARVHHVGPSKVHVIPHGAPDRPFAATDTFKARFGLEGARTIMTFGLLSPNKGIETIIRALPRILERSPDAVYVVAGATHPHLIAHEGERYREGLVELARSLGVEDHVRFINKFLDQEELVDLLQATDVYATPYLTETQITSGTLSYAIAVGKPIVSTPYWHAVEALADGVGVVVPFGDVESFARELGEILSNDLKRETMARRAYRAGAPSRWINVGRSYLEIVQAVRSNQQLTPPTPLRTLARPSLGAVRRMFDDVGMAQHAKFRVPDRRHGYCVDDNARALALFALLARDGDQADSEARLAYTAAAFVNHSWNEEKGRFRNFMSYDRRWLDDGGCDDCNGRSLHALALMAKHAPRDDLSHWATDLGRLVFRHVGEWTSLRARAHVARALLEGESVMISTREVCAVLSETRDALLAQLAHQGDWFEPMLAYDNALLPEALIRIGQRLGDRAAVDSGLQALDWLTVRQSAAGGRFRPIPTSAFKGGDHPTFDQQPLEALATIEACVAACSATNADIWADRAIAAFEWLGGENDLALPLANAEDGGCFDGLTVSGANQNQGAESILAYHLASAAMRRLMEARRVRGRET
jgi:glycosyltransferase involved in cell wall biosynthesis